MINIYKIGTEYLKKDELMSIVKAIKGGKNIFYRDNNAVKK